VRTVQEKGTLSPQRKVPPGELASFYPGRNIEEVRGFPKKRLFDRFQSSFPRRRLLTIESSFLFPKNTLEDFSPPSGFLSPRFLWGGCGMTLAGRGPFLIGLVRGFSFPLLARQSRSVPLWERIVFPRAAFSLDDQEGLFSSI